MGFLANLGFQAFDFSIERPTTSVGFKQVMYAVARLSKSACTDYLGVSQVSTLASVHSPTDLYPI
jgi:hypothetical protein